MDIYTAWTCTSMPGMWRPEVRVISWPKNADGKPIPREAQACIRGTIRLAIEEWFLNSMMSLDVRNAMHQAFIVGENIRKDRVFCMKGTYANVKFRVTGRSLRSADKNNAHKKFLVKILELEAWSYYDSYISWSWNHPPLGARHARTGPPPWANSDANDSQEDSRDFDIDSEEEPPGDEGDVQIGDVSRASGD